MSIIFVWNTLRSAAFYCNKISPLPVCGIVNTEKLIYDLVYYTFFMAVRGVYIYNIYRKLYLREVISNDTVMFM